MLLLALSLAYAQTEIGTTKKFGLGLESGSNTVGLAGKYWFGPKTGIAFAAGTSPGAGFHAGRASFEGEFVHWGDKWSWGQLPMYWHGGVDFGAYIVPGYPTYPRLGVGGGVGAALQLNKYPLEFFSQVGLAFYPLNGYCVDVTAPLSAALGIDVSVFCYVGLTGAAGARWYF